ncbi:MAG: hypothetical protein ACRD3S_18450, partial [Terracidiphilus sp.]
LGVHLNSGSGEKRRASSSLSAWHYWVYWAGVLCAIVAALTAFGVVHWPSPNHFRGSSNSELTVGSAHFRRIAPPTYADNPLPPLYPYSVIPGGVRSARELRNAIANDPVVAEHYANFRVSNAHVIELTRNREVYVSYRLGDRIYWTKKRLLLRAGETVITDGKHEARTRCGNRISETPVQPVSKNEPPNAAMNAPLLSQKRPASAAINAPPVSPLFADNAALRLASPLDPPSADPVTPGLPMLPQSPSGPPNSYIPPPYFPIVGGGPPSFPNVIPPPPPVATPEPGALSLLGLGLLVLATLAGLSDRRKYRKS